MTKQSDKLFKQFERRFSIAEINAYKQSTGYFTYDGKKRTHWIHELARATWAQGFIQFCVYHAEDADEWQKFRIALKGLNIHEKLCALELRWVCLVNMKDGPVQCDIEQCRIDNYIGALHRGGLLGPQSAVREMYNKSYKG